MRRLLFAFAITLSACCWGQSMKDIVRTMPDSITPLLTLNNRLDLVDYLEANMKAEVKNKLGGMTELVELTDTTARFRMTESSELLLRLIDDGEKKSLEVTRIYHAGKTEATKVEIIRL